MSQRRDFDRQVDRAVDAAAKRLKQRIKRQWANRDNPAAVKEELGQAAEDFAAEAFSGIDPRHLGL